MGAGNVVESDDGRRGSSVPVEWRNALSWKWARAMPRPLKGGFLTQLYVLGTMADSTGRIRFSQNGRPISRRQLAAAAGCDPKDTSRYLSAAVVSRVLSIEGERKNGAASLYILIVAPYPDWTAAVKVLEQSKRERVTPPWRESAEPARRQLCAAATRAGQPCRAWAVRGTTLCSKHADQRGPTPQVSERNQRGPTPQVPDRYPEGTGGDRPLTDRRGPTPHGPEGTDPSAYQDFHEVLHETPDVDHLPTGFAHVREGPRDHLAGLPMNGKPYRAAARRHFAAKGIEPTRAQIDEYAALLAASDQPRNAP